MVSLAGISTNPVKIEVIQNWPTPKDISDVRSRLGMFGYYQKFIRDYSKKARPLTQITEKRHWTSSGGLNRKKLGSS